MFYIDHILVRLEEKTLSAINLKSRLTYKVDLKGFDYNLNQITDFEIFRKLVLELFSKVNRLSIFKPMIIFHYVNKNNLELSIGDKALIQNIFLDTPVRGSIFFYSSKDAGTLDTFSNLFVNLKRKK